MTSPPSNPELTRLIEDPVRVGAVRVPDASRRAQQLALGLGWFTLPAFLVSSLTNRAFLLVYPLVLVFVVACSSLIAFWMAAWGAQPGSRVGRFRVATLLLVIFLVGVFCGIVRWFVVAFESALPPLTDMRGQQFLGVSLCLALYLAVSTPIVIGMLDSLIWIAVGLLKRPALRRMIVRVRGRMIL